jgi:hypothetical protein
MLKSVGEAAFILALPPKAFGADPPSPSRHFYESSPNEHRITASWTSLPELKLSRAGKAFDYFKPKRACQPRTGR